MQIKYGYNLLIATLLSFNVLGQSEIKLVAPSIGVGAGALSFYGDVGSKNINPLSNFRIGYNLEVNERFSNSFSLSLSLLSGKLGGNNGSSGHHLNFESTVLNGGLSIYYHLDNDYLLSKSSILSPYVGVGIGFMSFEPFADLKDPSGNTYNYWSDGSIRDKGESETSAYSAVIIKRDYLSETKLRESQLDGVKYPLTSVTFPVTVGTIFNLSSSLGLNLGVSYYFTGTDWLDNISSEGTGQRRGNAPKDHFLYSFVGLNYNFGKKAAVAQQNGNFADVDYAALERTDSDGDGVPDSKDKCSGTPAKAKVDLKGCPYDDDGDGIANELDQEPKTKEDAPVDANGVTLSKKAVGANKPVAGDRITPIAENDLSSSVPENFRWVDQDKDGRISEKEIGSAIDHFFEDDSNATLESIMGVIDYFFEQ